MSSEPPPQEPTPPKEPAPTFEPQQTPQRRSKAPIYAAVLLIVLATMATVWFLRFDTQMPVMTYYPSQQLVSADWAGYSVSSDLIAPKGDVTAVTGSWVVPEVNGTNLTFSAAWIGIGGQYDESLIQTGTEHSIVNDTTSYLAWYELLPDNSIYLNMSVHPGDAMSASINLQNSGSNTWVITIKNISNGEVFQKTVQYTSSRSSAEWIVERPTVNSFQYPLTNFGSVTFSGCSATIEGRTASVSGFPHSLVNMKGRMANDLVGVGGLSPDGASFAITFLASR